ncbi:MAG TPA: hypothetical protein VHD85_09940 [Terracidiphilus sp.]|nr:hypothetical protein [Terracidiphilus sp.]
MERSANMPVSTEPTPVRNRAVAQAAWHSLFWLVFANAIGVLLAVLLLYPALNRPLGEWTYGRWMMAHMNIELYGWTSLPLVGLLFHLYGADRGSTAAWCRPVLWVWSAALGIGVFSWLSGYSSGKLFLDWSGYARFAFCDALLALWLFLVIALVDNWMRGAHIALAAWMVKLLGLVVLLAVPFVLYTASSPNGYPPINPSTGGPTGTSQLESSLAVVLIVLILPFGIAHRVPGKMRIVSAAWIIFAAECVLCAALNHSDVSHHVPAQFFSLGSLIVWLPLTPAYYAAFAWRSETRRWRAAFLVWWVVLLVTGWVFFLPGVLDRFKFTDGLVGHSFVAMAGFASSLIVFVQVQLLGADGWIFNRSRAFILWHVGVIVYIAVMTIAGWREGVDPAFTIVPDLVRNVLYILRLISGLLMLLASLDWLVDASALLREPVTVSRHLTLEKTA